MKKKEEKIGLTPVSIILSIVGILIFASFIILPPVFKVTFKKEVVEPPKPEKLVIETMICTRTNYTVGNHKEDNEITMTYAKDSLRTYKKRTEQTFKDTVTYEKEKQEQGNLTTAYYQVNGVTYYNVSPKDSDAKIIIEEEFDLGIFKNEKVKINEKEYDIKLDYKQGDSVTGIVSALTNKGYNCKKSEQVKEVE